MKAETRTLASTGRFWAFLPAGLLLGLLGMQLAFLAGTLHDPSFAVEENYYDKAVSWDDKMEQDRRNAALGFRIAVVPAIPTADGTTHIAVVVEDEQGLPITGAAVEFEAFHNARAADVRRGQLVESGDGRYGGDLARCRHGLWELRLSVRRGADLFTHVTRIEIASAGSGA